LNSDEIRLKILKLNAEGFSRSETVQILKESCQVNEATTRYHIRLMPKWIGVFVDLKNAEILRQQIANIYLQTIREASYQLRQATNDNAKIGYMRVRLEAAQQLCSFLPAEMVNNTPPNIILSVENNTVPKPIDANIASTEQPQEAADTQTQQQPIVLEVH
jgi:hypothetical protein